MAAGDEQNVNIRRVILDSSLLQFGLADTSPQLKEGSDLVEWRNNADSDFIIVRGKDSVGDDDLVTRRQLNSGVTSQISVIRFALNTTATQTSTATIPANSRIVKSVVEITTAYDGGTTIDVGHSGTADLIQPDTKVKETKIGVYVVNQDTDWGGSSLAVQVTVGGAPAAGVGICTVYYIQTPLS